MNTPGPNVEPQASASGDRWLTGLIILLYGGLILAAVWAHEPWRDEAQTWLIGRDATLQETFELLPYQGHPALWYLMVRPLARWGLPYVSMSFLHAGLIIAAAFLWLRYSTLPKLTRVLFVFSFWMFWMFAVESRVYAVGILILFAIAAHYPARHRRAWLHGLLIALLFNSNLHMVFLGAALVLAFAWETVRGRLWSRGHVLALLLMAIGGGLLLWQFNFLWPPEDNMFDGRFAWINPDGGLLLLGALSHALLAGPHAEMFLAPFALAVLGLLLHALLARPIPLMMLLFHLAGISFMIVATSPNFHHYGLFMVGVVFVLWVAPFHGEARIARWMPEDSVRRRRMIFALNLCLVGSLYAGWELQVKDRQYEFSGSKRMADYLRQNKLLHYPVAAYHYVNISSLAPYLPGVKFWDIGREEWATYVRQDVRHRLGDRYSHGEALALLAARDEIRPPHLLLTEEPLNFEQSDYRLLYQVEEELCGSDERFYLYFRGAETSTPATVKPTEE